MPLVQTEFIADNPITRTVRVVLPYSGSENSRNAALAVASRSGQDEARLLDFIRSRGDLGATDEEIREHFAWSGDYERPRRWALSKDGKLVDGGQRRNAKGNLMTVWICPVPVGLLP